MPVWRCIAYSAYGDPLVPKPHVCKGQAGAIADFIALPVSGFCNLFVISKLLEARHQPRAEFIRRDVLLLLPAALQTVDQTGIAPHP